MKLNYATGAVYMYTAPMSELIELNSDTVLMLSEDPEASTEDLTTGETYSWE